MELHIKEGSPDGMYVEFKTYLMTWDELRKLIDYIEEIESGGLKKK